MAKHLQIVQQHTVGKALGKEQKRFNSLVKKIKDLRDQIEVVKDLDLELRRLGEERVTPAEKKAMAAVREWIMALEYHPARHKLGNKLAEKLGQILMEEISRLLDTNFYKDDGELQELYARCEASGRSYEEIREDEEAAMKSMSAQLMEEMYGLEIDPEDFDDPARMQEKLNAKKAEFQAAEQARAEQKAQRKKTDKQVEADNKRRAAETAVRKTAKQIYLELVRHFHPDQEQDEQRRLEKTEVMKQITAAYDADDHLRLLELQMDLLSSRDNVFAGYDDSQLRYLNQTLEKQVAELRQELYFASPEGNGNLYGMLFDYHRNRMLANVEQHIRHQKALVKNVAQNIKAVQYEKVFKQFIRDYELEEADDFFGDFW